MAIEIERKFLVKVDRLPALEDGLSIQQAYIPTTNGTTVRVRVADDRAYFCIKTKVNSFSRHEYEFPIPVEEAREMLQEVCLTDRIEKQRYYVRHDDLTWEIDVFSGDNEGLIVAEVELDSEDQPLRLPDWVDQEVTLDPRYSNYSLSRWPFKTW